MKKLARVAFCVLIFLLSTIGEVPAPKVHAANTMFAGKVVSWYQRVTDTAIDDLVGVLSDTGTEIVFRGYFKYWITPEYEFPELTAVIAAVKTTLPWVQFIGGVSASAFQPGDYWPNGTHVTADQMKQMLWILPNGTYAHHIEDPQLYVLDIAKPLARQFVISYSYKMIDAGFDMLWFDEINYIQDRPIEPYLTAWHEIASSVKDYAMSKYGRILPVSINGDALYLIGSEDTKSVWPYQDFLTVSIRKDTVRTGKMLDDWASYKAEVMQVYGMLPPILYFIDNDKLDVLASQSTSTQIKLLELWYDTAVREQVTPVFTLHYGDTYDALREGTYDAMKELTNSISTVHTVTTTYSVPFISTTTTTTTATITETRTPGLFQNPFDVALVVVVGVLGLAVIVLMFRKKTATQ